MDGWMRFGILSAIGGVVAAKPSIPILANILLEATGDEIILTATDLTVSMRASCEARIEKEGAITLPARRLFQLVRELTSGLSVANHGLAIELASLPEDIRGYGHVKENNLKGVRVKWQGLLARWRAPQDGQAQHAA